MPDALDGDYSRSRAVLIGTWNYRHLQPVPAAEHSLNRMKALLSGPLCGSWPEERIWEVPNRDRLSELPHELVLRLRDAADVALFYYVGHGQYDNDDRLCLALGDTSEDPILRTTTSLTFDAVRQAFRASKAATKIAILDCCFAGLAAGRDGQLAGTHDLPRSPGFYLMMASGEFSTAWCETGADCRRPQTYFTKYLIDLIEAGIPGQPAGLTLGPIFDKLADALVRDGKPTPGCRVSDHAADFVFAHNRANLAVLKVAPQYLAGALSDTALVPTMSPPSTQIPMPDSEPCEGNPATAGGTMKAPSGDMDADELYSTAYKLELNWSDALRNFAEMESLYRAAAEAGHADAMGRLGLILEGQTRARIEGRPSGETPDGDIDAAIYWYTKAAQVGSISGAFFLGRLYEERLGNWSDALKWYEIAVRGGHRTAQEALDGLRERLALGLGPLAHAHEFDGEHSQTTRSKSNDRKVGMFNKRADEQGEIIAKILRGQATQRDVARVNANYDRWKRQDWKGKEYVAMAFCADALVTACGGDRGEWGTLTAEEGSALLWCFSLACLPTESSGDDDARAFRGEIRGLGVTLRDYAQIVMRVRGVSKEASPP